MRYTSEELWTEFYEDYYNDHKNEALLIGDADGDVRFVTGDPEIDELEKRLSEGSISDEEVQRVLSSWAGLPPPKSAESVAEPASADTAESFPDLGDGFSDSFGG